MPRDPDHSATEIGYHRNAPAEPRPGSEKARKSRTASGRKQAAITDIRIHHIETVPMTAAQYARAVEALAVLIARYEREHPDDPTTA
ncbi:hypothetical protein [Actinoplanes derwentensis]|uniref:Uncharacterized protein n=1 Tax=Actinoplanes derwentensis TaxID=113562 RepID=A0A1H2C9F4_9ACTN|nr:hypothetical protein [Actinoplanes derwentensis]GID88951.1 hypothetical protein Ade03nite_78750 [Actinoplanes derwentensis]SDT67073.1 hypothetical protein SAMN04489716_5423 [Actinoplanes derwentensis]